MSLFALAIAFGVAVLLVPVIGAVAKRLGFVDIPNELAIHDRPIPRVGGLAIFAGFVAALAFYLRQQSIPAEQMALMRALLIGDVIIVVAGLLDDIQRISPIAKFLCQCLAASVVIGLGIGTPFLPIAGVGTALALFYLVGGANAMNFLDGQDGLAAGVACLSALGLAGIAAIWGMDHVSVLALALAGAILGFLPHNFPKARSFMGDVGSHLLGFNLAALGLLLGSEPPYLRHMLIPAMVLAIPILDTGLAIVRRHTHNHDVFTGDRGHTYDLLAQRWGRTRSTLAMWAGTALVVTLAVVAARLDNALSYALIAVAAAVLLGLSKALGFFDPLRSGALRGGAAGSGAHLRGAHLRGGNLQQRLRTLKRRYMHPVLLDLLVVIVSLGVALCLRFSGEQAGDWAQIRHYGRLLAEHIFFVSFAFAIAASAFGLYSRIWSYASGGEVWAIVGAGATGAGIILICDLLKGPQRPIPLGVLLMGSMMTTFGFIAVRYRERLIRSALWRLGVGRDTPGERVLIVGAGESGQLLAWRLLHQGNGLCRPVLFVDDDLEKVGLKIHGVPVLGTTAEIPQLAVAHAIDVIIIAIHASSGSRIDDIFDICQETGARIQVLPDIVAEVEGVQGGNGHTLTRDLTIEDLLGRAPHHPDEEANRALIGDRAVLITGAAGSIGSELSRQVARYGPAQLLLLDQDESGLFDLCQELDDGEVPAALLIGDIADAQRMADLWQECRPEVIFHCAAYKHVPLLERAPYEAVTTNIRGTLNLVRLAQAWEARRFIFVSTDKAVQPTCVMGATKRVGELLIVAMQAQSDGDLRLSAVRFGNVLGSRGSVVSIFARQIEHGGPVTVTDPEMTRYFMSIKEATGLIIQAGAYTRGGDLFMLDMGEPVRICDLAHKMIRLQGLRVGEDVAITFIGARPGEKLHETLFDPGRESVEPTAHPAIWRVNDHTHLPPTMLLRRVEELIALAKHPERAQKLRELLFDTLSLSDQETVYVC